MYYVWKRTPFLRVLWPFIAGIIAQELFAFSIPAKWLALVCCTFLFFVWHFFFPRFSFRHRGPLALLSHAFLFCLGLCVYHLPTPPAAAVSDTTVHRVVSVPKEKNSSYTYLVEHFNGLRFEKRKVIHLKKSGVPVPAFGEGLLVSSKPTPITTSVPYGFDAHRFYRRKDIHFSYFIGKKEDAYRLHTARIKWFEKPIVWRIALIEKLYAQDIPEQSKSVLAALLLGYSDYIDQELMQSYSQAGVVHVLAVSGLHVGLIYLLLAPLFARLGKGKWARKSKLFIPFVLLWVYAAITGFSPSVLRAAVMFSFFLIAEHYEKHPNGLNTLSASAFFLLLFSPELLFDIGFQLSYLAVLGILALDKPIASWFFFTTPWKQKMWKMMSVSLAAQLATTPISLYYFHQFPTYFLVANLVLVPLSTVILYSGLAFYGLCFWPWLAKWVVWITAQLTVLMNSVTSAIAALPQSLLHVPIFSPMQCLLLYAALFALAYALFFKKGSGLCWMALTLVVFPFFKPHAPEGWMVHSFKKHDVITYASRHGVYVWSDDSLWTDSAAVRYTLDPYLQHCAVDLKKGNFHTPDLRWQNEWLLPVEEKIIYATPALLKQTHLPQCRLIVLGAGLRKHFFTQNQLAELACYPVWICQEWSAKKKKFVAKSLRAMGGTVYLEEEGPLIFTKEKGFSLFFRPMD
jgi:competence protein ComEC